MKRVAATKTLNHRTDPFTLLVTGLFILMAGSVVAADYAYVTNNDNTLTLTGYLGMGGEIVVPNEIEGRAVTGIGDSAFFEMEGLRRITMPDSVRWIGPNAFLFCHGLDSVTLSTNLAQIGADAFFECVRLKTIQIPAGTTNVGAGAFARCISLTEIKVAASNTAYRDIEGVLYDKALTTLIQYPCGKTGPLFLPGTVTTVCDRALAYCGELRNVAFSAGVTHIGTGTFRSSRKLEGVYFAGDAPTHGADVFTDVATAVVYRMSGASGWETNFEGRQVAIWPASSDFTHVDNEADTNTVILTGYVGTGAEVQVPAFFAEEPGKTITRIGSKAFHLQTNLTGVAMSAALRDIGAEAFFGCSGLTTLTIPDGVTNLGERSFMSCAGLTNLVVGESVHRVQDGSFAGCSNLAGVYFRGHAPAAGTGLFDGSFPATVYYWPPRLGWGPEYGGRPTAIWFSPDDFSCSTNSYDTNSVTITGYHGPNGIVPIPFQIHGRTVTAIGYRAMYGQRDVIWASVPASVTNIADEAFLYSYALTNLVITGGVRRIGNRAFAETPMEKIILPTNVTHLGSGVFEYSGVTDIYFEGNAPAVAGDMTDSGSAAIVYYLPGMSGWGAALGGRPTAPWLPRVQAEDMGATATGFGFSVAWARGKTVVMESCESLTLPVWSPQDIRILQDGTGRVEDSSWTNHSARCYRLIGF